MDCDVRHQLSRDIQSVIKILSSVHDHDDCVITKADGNIFHVELYRKNELRKIRVVLNDITPVDIERVKKTPSPGNVSKEIWCRTGRYEFDIKAVK